MHFTTLSLAVIVDRLRRTSLPVNPRALAVPSVMKDAVGLPVEHGVNQNLSGRVAVVREVYTGTIIELLRGNILKSTIAGACGHRFVVEGGPSVVHSSLCILVAWLP